MDRIDLGFARDPQDILDIEIGLDGPLVTADEIGFVRLGPVQGETVLLRIDRHRAQPELVRGSHDANGDLATVGDKNAAYPLRHRGFHPMIPSLAVPANQEQVNSRSV